MCMDGDTEMARDAQMVAVRALVSDLPKQMAKGEERGGGGGNGGYKGN